MCEFNNFQLEEYKNISNAHFETNKQIGIFFRYYLFVASAPAAILVWFGKNENAINNIVNGVDTNTNLFIAFFLLFVAAIGIFSCCYLISLSLDSVLYARTVNGIRKHIFKNNIDFESHYRVLPKLTNQPQYIQPHSFLFIVLAFAIINSIYFSLGTFLIACVGDNFFKDYFLIEIPIIFTDYSFTHTISCGLVLICLHFWYYLFIANYRDNSYLKTFIIGIDIDGVLNKHRDMFCKILEQKTKKKLNPDKIIKIPVHLIPKTNVTIDDEFDVFNEPDYWKNQSIISQDANTVIKELKNTYGYKINMHSYRPWPQFTHGTNKKNKFQEGFLLKLTNIIKLKGGTKSLSGTRSLKSITKIWLKNQKIPYNKLFIEQSNIDRNPPSSSIFRRLACSTSKQFKNRYYYTNKKPYRYFVEDTAENAIKLASNCEYVLLYNQPYNDQKQFPKLPPNVLRVKDWNDIKNKIKELG